MSLDLMLEQKSLKQLYLNCCSYLTSVRLQMNCKGCSADSGVHPKTLVSKLGVGPPDDACPLFYLLEFICFLLSTFSWATRVPTTTKSRLLRPVYEMKQFLFFLFHLVCISCTIFMIIKIKIPVNPVKPEMPLTPGCPLIPDCPGWPLDPGDPTAPMDPVNPIAPVSPGAPGCPGWPCCPGLPCEPAVTNNSILTYIHTYGNSYLERPNVFDKLLNHYRDGV